MTFDDRSGDETIKRDVDAKAADAAAGSADTALVPPDAAGAEASGVAATVAATPTPPLATPPGTVAGAGIVAGSPGSSPNPSVGPSPRPSSAGREVSGRYTLGAVLGQGGMGEVLVGYDEQIKREVAIKRLRAEQPTSEELSRFVREVLVQGRLEHPAIVPVHDLVYDGSGRPYFVMKRLAGTDMHELLQRLRSGAEADVPGLRRRLLRAFADVCNAIEFAHRNGIVHRDLKPANIMLGGFGEVYVLDWGIARALDDDRPDAAAPSGKHDLALATGETQQGTVLGTPAYMAPEQLVGDRAGPAADIYALGCILYEIAAGEPLHPRNRHLGHALKVVDARPSKKRPDSPPELDAICERAIRILPEERFESARALGAAVLAFLEGDRDIAVRRELAAHHLEQARAAFARGSGEQDRRAAMQAAGRALALDPTATEAADLVTRLLLEPPAQVPAEVEEQLAAIDTETARSQGRLSAIAVMGYLGFVPLLLWSGVHDLWHLVAFAALAVTSGLQVLFMLRGERISASPIYLNACINAVLIGVVCRMVGPFIIAPTLVITTLMAYASHPRFGRIPVLAGILSAAVVIPWLLELAGVFRSTFHFTDTGALVLESPVVRFSPIPTQVAFAALLVALVGVVAALSRALAIRQREATRRLETQAWHLRQIVPAIRASSGA